MLQKDDCQVACRHKRALVGVGDFAPLPAVAMKIMDMVADPDTMAVDLEDVLQGDISLVVAILKLANSAFYGLRRQVVSLRHALVLLGKNEVQELVLSLVMFQTFKVPEGREKALMIEVWKHSLECGLAAECIAERCGVEDSMYFLGGMLHDIGKLVVIQKFLNESEALRHYGQIDGKTDMEAELEFLGCGHNELGSQLLHRWMFPPQLVEMVHNHHSYDGCAVCGRPSQILILANILCRWTVLKDLEEKDEDQEAALFALLLRCGTDSKIIPDEKALAEMEKSFRQKLEERADLLEMLGM